MSGDKERGKPWEVRGRQARGEKGQTDGQKESKSYTGSKRRN